MPTLKELRLTRFGSHEIVGRPYFGVKVEIAKFTDGYMATIHRSVEFVDRPDYPLVDHVKRRTLTQILGYIDAMGDWKVHTYNMLNRDAGPVTIPLRERGTCCDPATETYHSM